MSNLRGFAASLTIMTLIALLGCAPSRATAQAPAEVSSPAWPSPQCAPADGAAPGATEADGQRRGGWRPRLLDQVGPVPPVALLMPVEGVRVADVYPSFGDPRSGGRLHEGVDIMAPRGTPVRAAAPGFVVRVNPEAISVTIVGDGGIQYFYTHFDSLPQGLEEGQRVDVDTVIGFVGNTGNAAATAPHLHFGVSYGGLGEWCGWHPLDPLPWLVDRE
jgi:murein DD-endopeptidase MepM/ murein hydrolase activator NlpD